MEHPGHGGGVPAVLRPSRGLVLGGLLRAADALTHLQQHLQGHGRVVINQGEEGHPSLNLSRVCPASDRERVRSFEQR